MGQLQSIDVEPLCVPLPDSETDDHSTIYRNKHLFVENGGNFIDSFRSQPESKTLIEILRTSSVKFTNLPCVGERIKLEEDKYGEFSYITYKAFYDQVIAFGKGLLEIGLTRGDKVGIYSGNCIWWQTISYAASSVGIVVVPVYDSLGPKAADYILDHSEAKVLFTSAFKLENSKNLFLNSSNLIYLVTLFDEVPEIQTDKQVLTCKQILERGLTSNKESEPTKPDDLHLLMYTSGSTGVPKGCMMTQRNIVAGAASFSCLGISVLPGDVFLSFLPLAHIYAFNVEVICIAQGVAIGFARGQIANLMDDIKALKPTLMTAVPRVLNRVYDVMKEKISKLPCTLR